jgi:hypothetical protein
MDQTNLARPLKDLAISQSGFVFDPTSGVTFTVNATGQFILLKLRDGLDLDGVERELRASFDLGDSDDPARDVREFVGLLRDQGILPRESATEAR